MEEANSTEFLPSQLPDDVWAMIIKHAVAADAREVAAERDAAKARKGARTQAHLLALELAHDQQGAVEGHLGLMAANGVPDNRDADPDAATFMRGMQHICEQGARATHMRAVGSHTDQFVFGLAPRPINEAFPNTDQPVRMVCHAAGGTAEDAATMRTLVSLSGTCRCARDIVRRLCSHKDCMFTADTNPSKSLKFDVNGLAELACLQDRNVWPFPAWECISVPTLRLRTFPNTPIALFADLFRRVDDLLAPLLATCPDADKPACISTIEISHYHECDKADPLVYAFAHRLRTASLAQSQADSDAPAVEIVYVDAPVRISGYFIPRTNTQRRIAAGGGM